MSASSTRPLASSAEAAPATQASGALGIAAVVAGLVLALDQLTKQWALSALDDGPIDVIGSLRFKLTFNSGISFSLVSGWGGLISLLGLVVVFVLLRNALRWPGRLPPIAAGLVAGGALGNLLDRIVREGDGVLGGRVIDFIDLQWWPVFNVADMGVCIGAVLLAIASFRQEA